jgi:FHS family L-fucose permease-like MFS transporter
MKNKYLLPFILLTSLFFLWGFALNLNPILIPHLKKACQLTDFQSALIDSASYIAYFLVALPAGLFMKKYGYKYGITLGLILFAVGTFLFYPAAELRNYAFFLIALFVIASGLTFLETAANPYITVLGDADSATQRLNFAQYLTHRSEDDRLKAHHEPCHLNLIFLMIVRLLLLKSVINFSR